MLATILNYEKLRLPDSSIELGRKDCTMGRIFFPKRCFTTDSSLYGGKALSYVEFQSRRHKSRLAFPIALLTR